MGKSDTYIVKASQNTNSHFLPLIDVDCNLILIHPDLRESFLSTERLHRSELSNEESKKSTTDFFHVLAHPSLKQAQISAVFSPVSTIDEARTFLQALVEYSSSTRDSIVPVVTSVGVHPYHVLNSSLQYNLEQARKDICELLNNSEYHGFIKCIGETGLDYSEGFPDKQIQIPWWELQVSIAVEFNLPLFVHERLAFSDVVHTLENTVFLPQNHGESHVLEGISTKIPILIHCFTGTRDECRYYISRGCFISVSGFILRSGSGPDEVRACLKEGIIPLDKLMIETDSPYMGFPSCRDLHFTMEGDRFQSLSSKQKKKLLKGTYPNVPSSLPKVLDSVVDLLNEGRKESGRVNLTKEHVANVLFDNSIRFFDFDTDELRAIFNASF